MGKKKQARSVNDGKVRLETRIDPKIADQFRAIAEEAGVSVNQILQGLIIWLRITPSREHRWKRTQESYTRSHGPVACSLVKSRSLPTRNLTRTGN
ncbi:hypothetical protein C2E31_08760 [Rhodopirellula baltica]|nr:hypothetical protein C2E31_08760 [Rhodopirellula baltica]